MRRQFSIIVSFAMTINQSQGQSLNNIILYLPKNDFNHDQLYMTMSQIKIKESLQNIGLYLSLNELLHNLYYFAFR